MQHLGTRFSAKIAVVVAGFFMSFGAAFALDCNSQCCTAQQCATTMTSTNNYCCQVRTDTTYSCPLGWSVSGTSCVRSNGEANDAKGYYNATYGTCDATKTTKNCYKALPNSSYNGYACYSNSQVEALPAIP